MKNMIKSLIAAIGVALMMTGSVFAADVAKIGDTPYATLSAAFAAVTDDAQTVTIIKDVT